MNVLDLKISKLLGAIGFIDAYSSDWRACGGGRFKGEKG